MKRLLHAFSLSKAERAADTNESPKEATSRAQVAEASVPVPEAQAPLDESATPLPDHAQPKAEDLLHALAWPPPLSEGSAMRPGSRGLSRSSHRPTSREAMDASRQDLTSRGSSRGSARSGWSRGLQSTAKPVKGLTPRDGSLGMISEIERVHSRASSRPRTSSRPVTKEGARRRPFSRGSPAGDGIGPGDCIQNASALQELPQDDKDRGGVDVVRQRDKRVCCGLLSWPDFEDLPDLPEFNIFGMSLNNPLRARAIKLSVNGHLEKFWLLLAFLHFLIGLPEVQDNVFGCTGIRLHESEENHHKRLLMNMSCIDWHGAGGAQPPHRGKCD